MFHTRQTNILCLYIISLSVCTSPPSALTVNRFFSMEVPDTLRASGLFSNPAGLLMTSSVITSLLLLTPALKNNIYPVCHRHMVGVCVCMGLPVFESDLNDDLQAKEGGNWHGLSVWSRVFSGKVGAESWIPVLNQKPPWSLIIFQLGATYMHEHACVYVCVCACCALFCTFVWRPANNWVGILGKDVCWSLLGRI